jgi:two-component system chemotaxis sensor kinase CheA
MGVDSELFDIFRAEVAEQIEDLCDLLERPPHRWRIERLFQISHNVKGAARIVGVESIRTVGHALEDLFAAVRDGRELDEGGTDLARAGAEELAAGFSSMEGGGDYDGGGYRPLVDDWLAGATPTGSEEETAEPAAPSFRDPASVPTDDVSSEEEAEPETPNTRSRETTLRVATDKVDALMGLSGEFVSLVFKSERHGTLARGLASRLLTLQKSRPDLRTDPDVREALRLSRSLVRELIDHANDSIAVSDELQGSVRALRMVRVDGLRTFLNRSIREATTATGRKADLRIIGGETEVDRAILEQLRDPLIHLVRNAVAHGTEDPADRVAAGKPESGRIELVARTAGSWVEIVVRDDGPGVDVEAVRERALKQGMVTREDLLETASDEIVELVFRSGLSTTSEVTELAGRGVGLDVVRTSLANLGGRSSIRSSAGEGTEFILRVPLTRLTTNGILVQVGRQTYAIPTGDVERTLSVSNDDVSLADGVEVVRIDDSLVRIVPLGEILGVTPTESAEKPAVVLSDGRRRRALLVDEVLGQREYIVQPLAWNLDGAQLVSGTTVIDGGSVVPVLDCQVLLGSAAGTVGWMGSREIRQRRILVVDDSATSRTLERNILRTAGYEVMTAVDGERALWVLRSEDVDLVVSDVEMPKLDGFALTREIRNDPALERIPVILVTSRGSEEDKQRGAEAGADAYIVKGDFDQDGLLKTVGRLL